MLSVVFNFVFSVLHIMCVGGDYKRSLSSVTLHGGPAGGFTRAGQAMMSSRLQSNYSSTTTLHGGPVVLHPVRATPFFAVDTYLLSVVFDLVFFGI